jgi:hypothetical protein
VGSNPTGTWKSVCCEGWVLTVKGRCDELITRPEESYRVWWVVVCDLETSWMRRPWPTGGCWAKTIGIGLKALELMIDQSARFPHASRQRTQTRNSNHCCSVITIGKQRTSVWTSCVSAAFLLQTVFNSPPTIAFVCGCLSNGTITCKLPFRMHILFTYIFTIKPAVHIEIRLIM